MVRHLTVLPLGAGTARCYKSSETVQHLTQTQCAHQHHAHTSTTPSWSRPIPAQKMQNAGLYFPTLCPKWIYINPIVLVGEKHLNWYTTITCHDCINDHQVLSLSFCVCFFVVFFLWMSRLMDMNKHIYFRSWISLFLYYFLRILGILWVNCSHFS